jgi:hypothetical protein
MLSYQRNAGMIPAVFDSPNEVGDLSARTNGGKNSNLMRLSHEQTLNLDVTK